MQKKNVIQTVKRNGVFVACASALAAASSAAHAELPAAIGTAFTSIQTGYTDMETAAWPIIGTIVTGFILVKLFKKFANKAS